MEGVPGTIRGLAEEETSHELSEPAGAGPGFLNNTGSVVRALPLQRNQRPFGPRCDIVSQLLQHGRLETVFDSGSDLLERRRIRHRREKLENALLVLLAEPRDSLRLRQMMPAVLMPGLRA